MKHERINCDLKIMQGKPVIKGTRVPVETILRWLGKGLSFEDVMQQLLLSREDILAAQSFAADYLSDERVLPAAE